MSEFYQRMAATALRLIATYGQLVTLKLETPGKYDPATGKTGPAFVREQTGQAVLADYSRREFETSTLLIRGDKRLKLAAKGLEWVPTLATKAVIDGKAWSVISISEINPAGTPIVYDLQVRP